MELTLNGLTNPSNIITFTNCPTILTISETETIPSRANVTLTVQNLGSLAQGVDYYISVNGYEIHSVWTQDKEVGQNFYLTKENTIDSQRYVIQSIINALRNVSEISANYRVFHVLNEDGTLTSSLCVYSKDIGSVHNVVFKTNLPTTCYVLENSGGYSTNSLAQGKTNTVNVDIYKTGNTSKIGSDPQKNMKLDYQTTLSKNYVDGDLSFDLSPIFAITTNYNELSEYNIAVYTISDNKVTNTLYLPKIYAVNGYLVNQGGSFIPQFTNIKLAQNVYRGVSRNTENNTILYVYDNSITFSLYNTNDITNLNATINYLDSAFNTVHTETKTLLLNNSLNRIDLQLNEIYRQCYYIDIIIGGLSTLRYNIIKPLSATSETQRIYWTNSYGGTSFFDFTGDRTEQRKTDVEYYQTQLFDYYKKNEAERNIIYNKDVDVTVNLKTHNIEKDGQWSLFDLQNSWNAWTVVNGTTYKITITDLKITESSVSGVYQGEITYEYSLGDSF